MRQSVRWGAAAAALVVMGGLAVQGVAQTRTPEQVVEHREDQMEILGNNIRVVGRFAREGTGSIADVLAAARAMNQAAQDIPGLFPAGTGIGVGDSKARPEIWQDWAAFTEIAGTARTQIAALVAAAEGGNADAVRAQFARVGQACSACHQRFRAE